MLRAVVVLVARVIEHIQYKARYKNKADIFIVLHNYNCGDKYHHYNYEETS